MRITIPQSQKAALQVLLGYGSEKLQALRSALASLEPELWPGSSIPRLATALDASSAEAEEVLYLLLGLSTFREQAAVDSGELAESLATAMKDEPAEFRGDIDEVSRFLEEALRGGDALEVTAKALTVLQDNERYFMQARILTDLRPVFRADAQTPAAHVIVHNLKLSYRSGFNLEQRDFFIALDHKGLDTLTVVLERAKSKDAALEKLSEKLDIPVLKVRE
ncbi:MAG TPA: hypothetical protein VGD06_09440 [Acidobacteriota bacterium]